MTELLERAVKATRNLPATLQDDIARVMLALAGAEQPLVQLAPEEEEEESFAESLTQATGRQFATDEQIRAIWAKHGL